MNTRVDASSARREARETARALWQLTKPGVSRLVFVTTWLGAALAPDQLLLWPVVWTISGTCLIVASANTLNMYLEHEVDALMERTRLRPLPAGRLSREVALVFGCALGALGLFILGFLANPLTCALGAFALLTYVLVYTPLKAKSSAALYVGAVPGAMPPVLGYAGVNGALDAAAWSLFAVLFVWQIPHFLAITVFRRDEYAKAGLQVMPVAHGMRATKIAIQASSVALFAATVLPYVAGLGGTLYLVAASVSGCLFCAWALFGHRDAQGDAGDAAASDGTSIERWARRLFFGSMPYLIVLFGTLALVAP